MQFHAARIAIPARNSTSPPLAAGSGDHRALIRSQSPGTLELAFFGGEPLVEADLYSRTRGVCAIRNVRAREAELALSMTTNGTLDSPAACSVMALPQMQLAISHDGLPSVHDQHRVTIDGQPSSRRVQETMNRLVNEGKEFRVVTVVRPDSVESLPAGMEFLYACGVRRFDPSRPLGNLDPSGRRATQRNNSPRGRFLAGAVARV